MTRKSESAWKQFSREVTEKTDLRSAYESLGVEITGAEPNANGWLECRAYGHDDRSPSAGINVSGDGPELGRYKEFVGDGLNLSLFNFAVHAGKFKDWKEAREHYAKLAGVKPPRTKKKTRSPQDSLEFREYNQSLVYLWCSRKTGIIEPAVKACGGQIATESKKHTVVCLPSFGPNGTNDDPTGWASWNVTGNPLEIFTGKGQPPKQVKVKTASGSKAGWMGKCGIESLPNASVVVVTEGPTDMLGLVSRIMEDRPDLLGEWAVICNSAGAMERNDLESVAMFAGKNVVVVPDCDQAGQTGCRRRAEAIAEVAETVRLVNLPFEITPNHGKDLRDYFAAGNKFEDFFSLVDNAQVIRRKITAETVAEEKQRAAEPVADKDRDANTHIEEQILERLGLDVLGEMEGGKIKVFSEFHRKIDIIPDVSRLSYERLIQIVGPKAKAHVVMDTEDASDDMIALASVKTAIAYMAGFKRVENSETGLGCWRGIDEDGNSTSELVLVQGGEGAVLGADRSLSKITKPRHGSRLLDISSSSSWYDFDEMSELIGKCDQRECIEAMSEFEAIVDQWHWANQGQMPKIVAATATASWIQTIWRWRPQVSVIGITHAGKSTLFKMLENFYGGLAITSSHSTAAGIRQAISRSAAVILLDEFENSRHRNETLDMLRASGRGDRVFRGTSSHKVQEFNLQHICWVAGIESGLNKDVDRNRFIRLEIIKPQDRRPLQLPKEQEIRVLGKRILAVALTIGMQAAQVAEEIQQCSFDGIHQRVVESYSVPAAVYSLAMGEGEVGTPAEVLKRMLGAVDKDESVDDAEQLLNDIFASVVSAGRERGTVGQIIKNRTHEQTLLRAMEGDGIGVVGHRSGKSIFVSPQTVSRRLLKDTPWVGKNLDEILKRIPNAEKGRTRMGGSHSRGVFLPLSLVVAEDESTATQA